MLAPRHQSHQPDTPELDTTSDLHISGSRGLRQVTSFPAQAPSILMFASFHEGVDRLYSDHQQHQVFVNHAGIDEVKKNIDSHRSVSSIPEVEHLCKTFGV
jgi:hypothetical protein